MHVLAPHEHDGSGLTRAVLRGGRFRGVHGLGDLTSGVLHALHDRDRVFCYAYHADLDALGHVYGPGSDPWRYQLAHIDQLAATIAAGLPQGGMLVVTADHGMVTVTDEDRVDFDTEPALQDGVRMLGGEPRVRHVYTEPGATSEVRHAWHEVLGEHALVLHRDEAIQAGWFGPHVAGYVRPRIGDLVVAAQDNLAVIRSTVESRLSRFTGQHGSLTAEEQLVPVLALVNAD
ncbi:Type I phosphodiesterase / nucleotide pyrophosphatase [Goodfellowiella coeruleoviolacea]|uniref:Type I phosphodiesterase / nucleotide pyrophosphatase n=1 Tax=Goodfellowiella coeruleoviolacea TaxID=334858 RepID=A0AAE3GE37_9PSEU|nr:Type I phosphodiesterase / nucleotide pyrophosphatase [Goodfellowiella coeruleoviolacea]